LNVLLLFPKNPYFITDIFVTVFFFFAKYADFYIHSLRDLYFDIFSCRRVGAILECVRASCQFALNTLGRGKRFVELLKL